MTKYHPSEFIRDELEARGWSDDDLWRRIGDPANVLAVQMVVLAWLG